MICFQNIFGVALTLVLFGIAAVSCLECYECSSLVDEKCGVTWGFTGSEGVHYKVDCPTNGSVDATACWKYVVFNTQTEVPVVYRSCWYPHWNASITIQPWYPHWNETVTVEGFTPSGCSRVMGYTHGRSCYCTDNTQPCNSVYTLAPSYWPLLATVVLGGGTLLYI